VDVEVTGKEATTVIKEALIEAARSQQAMAKGALTDQAHCKEALSPHTMMGRTVTRDALTAEALTATSGSRAILTAVTEISKAGTAESPREMAANEVMVTMLAASEAAPGTRHG